MNETRLTAAQAADALGISPRRVRALIDAGRLAAEQEQTPRGPVWWITAEALAAYVPQPPGRPKQPAQS